MVHCSNLSNFQHSLSLDCSCSPCGCGSLCGLSLPNKPLFSQVPSASRSPELDRLACLEPALFLGSCNDLLSTFLSCLPCFSSCCTLIAKGYHSPSCCGSLEHHLSPLCKSLSSPNGNCPCPSSCKNSSSGCSSSFGQHSQVSLSSGNCLFPQHHGSTTCSNSRSASSDSSCSACGCCSSACKHNSSSSPCSHHSFVADCSQSSSSYSTSSS